MTKSAGGVRRDRWATTIRRVSADSESISSIDIIAVEEPLEIRLRCGDTERAVSVTMRTPGDEDALAIGFLFGEGILSRDSAVNIQILNNGDGKQNVVLASVADDAGIQFEHLARNFYATSSCGVCGKASLDAIKVAGATAVEFEGTVAAGIIPGLADAARHGQQLFDETGGLHAAALFDLRGNLLDVKEDVGRHNALDKLIGRQVLEQNIPCRERILFLSGRASFELIQKAVMAGIAIVCAVGAPSSLAVATAREFGVTLCGFVRDGRFNIYSGKIEFMSKINNTEEFRRLKVGVRLQKAAGLQAIVNTTRVVMRESGIIRGPKLLTQLNQKGGIDCTSCAWADPDGERTHAEFCENGAKAISDEATTKRVTPEFFAKYSVSELSAKSDHWLNSQGRITSPMLLDAGASHFRPVTWEEALRVVAEELGSLKSPDEALFYTSGRTSNEAAFLYQLFARNFGTNNLPDCSNMCHESTSYALSEAIGIGKATIRLEDLETADLILIIGQNPGTNAPRMMSSLETAKNNGGKIIAVNPLPEAGFTSFVNPNPEQHANLWAYPFDMLRGASTKLADLYLPIRIGGDHAFLKGVMKVMLEREKYSPTPVFDHVFIDEHTEGFQDFIPSLEAASWDLIVAQSGLSKSQIEQTADMFLAAKRVVTCWAMGVTQHKQAVATIRDIANLHFLTGQIGREGAGLCPVRGHSNVQGDRSMGVWEQMNPKFRAGLEKEFHFKTPKKDGLDTVGSIRAMHDGRAKVFFGLGGNFLAATPDTDFTRDAMAKCSLTAQVITKLNRTALSGGKRSLILPCLGRTEIDRTGGREQFVSTESTMLNVQMSKGILEPASELLRSEVWIVGKLAQAVLKNKMRVDWERFVSDYDHIRDAISRVVAGCENYNQRVRVPGGFYMPNPPRERIFPTETGRANFHASAIEPIELGDGELMMTTIRAHDQFNTTVYKEEDRYRGISGSRRVILMNADDLRERGLEKGQIVDLTSDFNGRTRRAESFVVVPYEIPRDCAATYFPEANPLVPIESVADKSNCPTSKLVKIRIEPQLENASFVFAGKFDG